MQTIVTQLLPLVSQSLALAAALLLIAASPWLRSKLKSKLAADALSVIAATACTLVVGAADEARALKAQGRADLLPGVRDRVLGDLKRMAPAAIEQLQRLQGLDPEALDALLAHTVEAQVEGLRQKAGPLGAIVVNNTLAPRVVAPGETLTDASPEVEAASDGRLTSTRIAGPSGQSGRSELGALVAVLVIVGIGAALAGCPNWNRPACEAPGTYRCEGDRPQYCAPSKEWTTAGSTVCGPAEVCVVNAEGVAHCTPNAATDGGVR